MRTTADDRAPTAIPPRSGPAPHLASGHPPTPLQWPARPRTRIPWSPLPARAGCRARRPRRRPHPVRPTCSAGSRRHLIPPPSRATTSPASRSRAPTASRPDSSPSTLPRIMTSAGTVLGYRYRMEELLAESSRSVTWRAFDLVLSRSVVVHLLAPLDPEAADILETRPARLARRRLPLPAGPRRGPQRRSRDRLATSSASTRSASRWRCCSATVRCRGSSRPGWCARSPTRCPASTDSGLYHQRINPDTVILTPDGHVKIVGLLIEAALRPAPGNALPRTPAPRPRAGRRGRSGPAALRLPGLALAGWPGLQPAGRAGRRPPPGEPAPGPRRGLPRPGRGLRPDPRRPAPPPRRPPAPRPTTWSTR